MVTTPDEIARMLADADATEACIGVIAWMHTFSPAKMWIGGLTNLRKPLVHLHTQFNRDLPWARDRHGLHEPEPVGPWRPRVRVHPVATRPRPEDDRRALGGSRRRADGWAGGPGPPPAGTKSQRLRIARFGDNMREVAVTEGDKVEAQARLGFAVNGYGVNELAAAVDRAPDDRIDGTVAQYEAAYDVGEPLRRGGARHDELRYAARIEVALRSFLEEGGFGAFTDTFEDLGELRQLPGIAVQRLMADGYGFGAEGDWKAGALVRILKVMGEGLPGGTSFMEDYTYHLGDPVPEVLGAHMLEVCPSIANGHISCEIHPLSIGGRSDPVRLVFDAAPGPAVILGLADLGRRFRLISSTVDIVEPDAPLPSLPVARAVWRPRPDLATAAEAWLTAGGPHHTALTTALPVEPIEDFAEIADIELVSIDAATTVPAFRRELRWNQAYYHLRGGI